LDEQALKRNHDSKVKKKVKFSNVVEVLGETSVGRGVCSLSIWLKDISLLTWGGELQSFKPKDKVHAYWELNFYHYDLGGLNAKWKIVFYYMKIIWMDALEVVFVLTSKRTYLL